MIRKLVSKFGVKKTLLLITVFTVLSSNIMYIVISFVLGNEIKEIGVYMASIIPAIVAPLVSYFFVKILHQLDFTEVALRESEEKFRSIGCSALDGIIMVNSQGKISFWNNSAEKIFGYNNEEVIEKDVVSMLIPKKYHQPFHNGFPFFKLSGKGPIIGKTIEIIALHKNGTELPVEISTSSIQLSKQWQAICVVRDISARKQSEEKLMKTLTELQETRDILIQSEKLSTIGQLTTGIAHEIMNPVNIISIRLQMLQELAHTSSEISDAINICKKQIERIGQITNNIGQFVRVRENEKTLTNLNDFIEKIIYFSKSLINQQNVKIETCYDPDLPSIPLVKDRIQQVFLNIFSNSMDAMNGGSNNLLRITTKLTPTRDSIIIKISDTGKGIDPGKINKIFDPFFTTKDIGDGMGLGLYISHRIISDHSGKIWVENNDGGGVSFNIEFPI